MFSRKSLLSLLIASSVILISLMSCSPMPTDVDVKEEIQIGRRDEVISLNGEWDFYTDAIQKVLYHSPEKTDKQTESISGGDIYSASIKIDELTENGYYKMRAQIRVKNDIKNTNYTLIPRIGVRIGTGNWSFTDVSYYQDSRVHWVDLSVFGGDLVAGENNVEVCSNLDSGFELVSDDGLFIQLKDSVYGTKWTKTIVPGSAEKSVVLSHLTEVRPDNYNGITWYRRGIEFPDFAKNKKWWLCFDAIDYRAEVWINSYFLGSHEGGYTSFEFCLSDLPDGIINDGVNELAVRVTDQNWNHGLTDDDIHIKETLAGFVQDTRKLNYSGIWQSVYLEARGEIIAQDIYVETIDALKGRIRPTLMLINSNNETEEVVIRASVDKDHSTEIKVKIGADSSGIVELPEMIIEDPRCWSANDPFLYELELSVTSSNSNDTIRQKFGIRSLKVAGTKILLNDQPIFLTGMLHWGSYYDNYTPAIPIEQARYEIEALKEDGFNAIKYCLLSPPDYILELCDELGMYVYIEYPIWNPVESDIFFERAYLQMMDMVTKDRRFASVLMSDFNCEDLEFSSQMNDLMQWCVSEGQNTDPNRLFTDNSSNGEHRYGDFATCHPYYQVNCYKDMLNGWIMHRGDKPLILGEFADISVLRDLAELTLKESPDYSWYHDYYGDFDHATILREAGYSEETIESVIKCSIDNAQELRKFFTEASKSNNHVAGLFLTHISESPQGWADGWFDDLNNKRFNPEVVRAFASETVLLLERNTENFRAGEMAIFGAGLSHYSGNDLNEVTVAYTLSEDGRVVISDNVRENQTYENGKYYRVGDITLSFPETTEAKAYSFKLILKSGSDIITENEWNIWAYPSEYYDGADIAIYDPRNTLGLASRYPNAKLFRSVSDDVKIVITSEMNNSIMSFASNGKSVIYIGQGTGTVKTNNNWDFNRLSFAFTTNEENSLIKAIKTSGYGGLQFLELATQWHLELPAGDPQANLIGRFATTQGYIGSYLGEYKVGSGRILQTTLRLGNDALKLGGGLLTHESLCVDAGDNPFGAYILDRMIIYLLEK